MAAIVPFTAPACLTRISYAADGGLHLSFTTQEMTAQDKAVAGEYHQQFGWLCFKPNEWEEKDLPSERAVDGSKTPSQRLRSALYKLWEVSGNDVDFDVFYKRRMEMLIEHVKEKAGLKW